MSKVMVHKVLALIVALSFALSAFTSTSPVSASSLNKENGVGSAVTCRQYASYTDYYNNKPTLYIYGVPNYGTDSRGIGIYYYNEQNRWEQVPTSSEWGIQMIPQVRSGEWTGYYIATRWLWWVNYHPKWNDDWRWYVQMCR